MKFNLFMGLRNDMLNKAYREVGVGNRVWLGTQTTPGSPENEAIEVTFSQAALSKLQLTQTVNFLINAGVTVSSITISSTETLARAGTGDLGVITLTGDDRIVFDETGAYVIAQLVIELLEVQ